MAWGFRKRISIGKLLKFNISKSGVSTTIGVKGFSVNVGKKGVYKNMSIPGTGLYSREKIADVPMVNNNQQNIGSTTSSNSNLIAALIIIALGVLFFGFVFLITILK